MLGDNDDDERMTTRRTKIFTATSKTMKRTNSAKIRTPWNIVITTTSTHMVKRRLDEVVVVAEDTMVSTKKRAMTIAPPLFKCPPSKAMMNRMNCECESDLHVSSDVWRALYGPAGHLCRRIRRRTSLCREHCHHQYQEKSASSWENQQFVGHHCPRREKSIQRRLKQGVRISTGGRRRQLEGV